MPPHTFLQHRITSQSIRFGGRYINLTQLATFAHVDKGYVSRILRGIGSPSLDILVVLAGALHMTLDDFYRAIKQRRMEELLRKSA